MIDTGSMVNVLSLRKYREIKKSKPDLNMYRLPKNMIFRAVNKGRVDILGYNYFNILGTRVRFYVTDSLGGSFDAILGDQGLKSLQTVITLNPFGS